MGSKTVKIPTIGSSGCIATIRHELSEISGVMRVKGHPETQIMDFEWKPPADWTKIEKRLIELDYAPKD
ncbi:hypothetical protein MASR2M15_23480 [Anaerolineales bacterium]